MTGYDPRARRLWSAAHTLARPTIAVVTGVSGSGKATVSALVAAVLSCQFQDGDDLHPPVNVEKMHDGTPLMDAIVCLGCARSRNKSIAGAHGASLVCSPARR